MADHTELSAPLLDYVRQVSLREDDLLAELRVETAGYPMGAAMQVMAEEGQLLALLVQLAGARTVVEVGTFTGYSTLCMARALPDGGRIITCDITDKWLSIADEYWKRAGLCDVIEVRVGPATDTLAMLLRTDGPSSVDLVFIDADKANYVAYYEAALRLVRPGGLIVVDNTLFFGRVADSSVHDADTAGIRELNALLRDDVRVDISLLTIADGVTLARKR